MKNRLFCFLALFFCFILSSCTIPPFDSLNEQNKITISLIGDEHTHILSRNPVVISKGESATFELNFDESYHFVSSSLTPQIENSKFTFSNLQYSQNIYVYSGMDGDFKLQVINDENKGHVSITPAKDQYIDGEEVSISITSNPGYKFMCYTFGHEYRNIGMYNPTGMPLSFEETYTFKITGDMVIYANYFENDLLLMRYFANGGKTIDGEEYFTVDYEIVEPFVNPVTIVGSYYLFRDGYTLVSYNTKPDGSGVSVGIGSRVKYDLNENGLIELYAIWAKWSDESNFDFVELENGSFAVSNYFGDETIAAIPDYYNGKPVTSILNSAFKNCSLSEVVLGPNIDVIEEKAFISCPSLITLYLYNGVKNMSELSFSDCPLKTIHINRMSMASDSTSNLQRDLSYKIDKIENMEKQRLIFVGFSTITFNHDFSPFAEKYPNKDVYVYGMIAGCNFYLQILVLTNKLSPNDNVVICPLETVLNPASAGGTLAFYKYCLDEISLIDYGLMSSFLLKSITTSFSSFSEGYYCDVFNSEKQSPCDEFGSIEWGPESSDENNYDPTTNFDFSNKMNDDWFSYLADVASMLNMPNKNIFFTWSTYNQNSVTDLSEFYEYESYVRNALSDFSFFDSIIENIYPGNYFRENDSIHLSTYGSKFRILRWIEELEI